MAALQPDISLGYLPSAVYFSYFEVGSQEQEPSAFKSLLASLVQLRFSRARKVVNTFVH
jgi:hypothetical protein